MNWKALIISHLFVISLVVGLAVTRVVRYLPDEDFEPVQEIALTKVEPPAEPNEEEFAEPELVQELPPPPPPTFAELSPASELSSLALPNPDMQIDIELQTDFLSVEREPAPLLVKKVTPQKVKLNKARVPTVQMSGTLGLKDLDTAPTLLRKGNMRWPSTVRARSVDAVLKVELDESGYVRLLEVVSIDDERFRPSLKNYLRGSRFTVPKQNGKPVKVKFNWPLTFQKR